MPLAASVTDIVPLAATWPPHPSPFAPPDATQAVPAVLVQFRVTGTPTVTVDALGVSFTAMAPVPEIAML